MYTRDGNCGSWDGNTSFWVELMGSVDSYDIDTGVAVLTHSGKGVGVDVSLLVDDLRFTMGQWLNVIGYLEHIPNRGGGGRGGGEWLVKAIMVWPVSPGFNLT